MSRSRRKFPRRGNCADSDKWSKEQAHRRERRAVNVLLDGGSDGDDLPHVRELSDPYDYAKDGKTTIDPNSRWMRK